MVVRVIALRSEIEIMGVKGYVIEEEVVVPTEEIVLEERGRTNLPINSVTSGHVEVKF
jgi:hypothetical protein